MNKRILVLLAHPDSGSLNAALAERYCKSARDQGAEVVYLQLGTMQFDLVLRKGYSDDQSLEPDLQDAQEKIEWAQQLVIFSPLWWGSIPALFKGFIDRVFLPGWAFTYVGKMPKGLLTGRNAHVVTTMDSPGFWYRIKNRNSLQRTLGSVTLAFCGFKTSFTMLYNVKHSAEATREKWMTKMDTLAARHASAS